MKITIENFNIVKDGYLVIELEAKKEGETNKYVQHSSGIFIPNPDTTHNMPAQTSHKFCKVMKVKNCKEVSVGDTVYVYPDDFEYKFTQEDGAEFALISEEKVLGILQV